MQYYLLSCVHLFYEFIFYFQKVENFLNNRGIEFINRKMGTFDIDINNIQKTGNDNSTRNSVTNSDNPNTNDKKTNQQKKQIEDVVSGYE